MRSGIGGGERDALESAKFGKPSGVGADPGFEAVREDRVGTGGEINEAALSDKEQETKTEISEDQENDELREERLSNESGQGHAESY